MSHHDDHCGAVAEDPDDPNVCECGGIGNVHKEWCPFKLHETLHEG